MTTSISDKYSRSIIRMVGATLLTFSLLAIAASGYFLLVAAQDRLERAVGLAQVSLPYSMWNFDDQAIGEILDALMLDDEVVHVGIRMEGVAIDRFRSGAANRTLEHYAGSALHAVLDEPVHYEGEAIGSIHVVQSRVDMLVKVAASIVAAAAVTALLLVLLTHRSLRLTERFIFRPLQSLEDAAATIAEGDLERAIDTSGDDEIGSLARSLNVMRQSIQGLVGELKDQNRVLEAKVAERTAELAEANRRLNTENLRLGAELDVTRRLQEMLLPREEELRGVQGLDIGAFMEPASEVGGDYFDVLADGDRVRIGIGDVTGHGLESGVLMVMTQSAVRTLNASAEEDLSRMVDVLNKTICGNVERMGSEKNLTFALIDYRVETANGNGDGTTGHLKVVGQHESLLVFRRDGRVEELDTLMLGMPIGLVEDVGEFLGEASVSLQPGDVVVLYTDGITEAADSNHRLFGLERLKATAGRHRHASADEIKGAIIDAVKDHIGEQTLFDDLTLLVLKQQEVAGREVAGREVGGRGAAGLH